MIEYDPQPPYDAGSPDRAPAEVAAHLRAAAASLTYFIGESKRPSSATRSRSAKSYR